MALPDFRSPQSWIITAASIAVVGGSVWALSRGGNAPAGVAIPRELSVESLKAQAAAEPGRMMNTVRDTMRRDDLTDEQRRQVAENMRKVWEDTMQKRVEEYYAAASDEDRKAILDRQIDEFEQRRKEWEERRKQDEKKAGKDGAERGPGFRGLFGPQSKEERKERSESRDPDKAARQMAYFAAVRERMGERGIKAPFGPGGGFGGGPGGPRPGRGP
jgi:vacuolar-type H+-ATPase subunit I/STV1